MLVVTEDDNPVGALQVAGVAVVNCAAAGLLVPDAQVAVTLQSYNELEVKPLKFAEVPV